MDSSGRSHSQRYSTNGMELLSAIQEGQLLSSIPPLSSVEAEHDAQQQQQQQQQQVTVGVSDSNQSVSSSTDGSSSVKPYKGSYLHARKLIQVTNRREKLERARSLNSVNMKLHLNASHYVPGPSEQPKRSVSTGVNRPNHNSLIHDDDDLTDASTIKSGYGSIVNETTLLRQQSTPDPIAASRDLPYGGIMFLKQHAQNISKLSVNSSFRTSINNSNDLEVIHDDSVENEHTSHRRLLEDDEEDAQDDEKEKDVIDDSPSAIDAIYDIVFGKGILSWFLLAIPMSLISVYGNWSPTYVFWFNFIALIPLATMLGDFTEEVAVHTNETIGGLINASFGNAVEVIIAIQALIKNEIRVVQASMLGSIFSNLLLVLGSCFFFGGLVHKEQTFNATAATANVSLLALSSIALVLPTPFAEYYDLHDEHVLLISRISAIFLIFMYIQLLIFQLRTHTYLFEENGGDGDDGEQHLAAISFGVACLGLLTITCLVALFSEYLVSSIEGFTEASGISRTFVGIVILPIVGNAVEHITAVTVAMKNKMDLAMGIAVGSCTQISLFVTPLSVLVGWMLDRDMTLNFPVFEILLYVLSIFTVSVVCSNPRCNWLEGSLLICTYVLIAIGFWFENVAKY